MENIYGQTENERNSIVELPDGYAEKSGNTLYSWLGSLWRGLHKGDGMIRGLQESRGIRIAQLYLDVLEAAKLQDRYGAPVFHRELWHPIVVRLSKRDTSRENMLKIGIDGVLGEQGEGSVYGEGTELFLGRPANFENYVTYPIDEDIAGGAVTIVDNIVNPSVFMERGPGKDYEIVDGSIVFHRDNDPLGENSKFDRYDIPGVVDEDGEEVSDMEAVLWASDVLFDRNYIADHISYALGANAPSSDVVKRILNAAWSSTAIGLTPELVKTLLAAMLNVPVIQNDMETVKWISVENDEDGNPVSRIVSTDRGSYRVSLRAKIRKDVVPGAVLARGDLLDESIRIYPFTDRVSVVIPDDSSSSSSSDCTEMSVSATTPYSMPIEEDIPSITIPPSMIRARTEYGLFAMWDVVDVKNDSMERLYFDIGGKESDVLAFWEDVWKRSEESGVGMESIIGKEGTKLSPAAFFLKNVVGANTLFVVVDRAQVDDASMMRDPMFFDMLSAVVPSASRLFLVEHRSVGGDDLIDLGGLNETDKVSAALPNSVDVAEDRNELVHMRFFRPPPAHVRG